MSAATRVKTASRTESVEIRTPAALAALAKKFAPVLLQDNDVPVPPANADYFGRMNLPTNIELDNGNYHTIDVQFDTRFIDNYIKYHVSALAPELNFKGHPFFSPLSYVGYNLQMVYFLQLACDATFRAEKSWHASRFMSDAESKDLYDVALNSHVPTFMSDLLMELAPVYDPRRSNLQFVPTLAGLSMEHDFGRTIPPALYYAAHHLLASTRTNKDPDDVLDDCMSLDILTLGNMTLKVNNYLGTWYSSGHHENWYNRDFTTFFNPLVGRFLTQRPTFARLGFETEFMANDGSGNPYVALLLASPENVTLTTTLLHAMSQFTIANDPKAPKLGSVIASLSGSLLLTYSIEPPTLPTWTAAKYESDDSPNDVSHQTFASDHKFLVTEDKYDKSVDYPTEPAKLAANLYHVLKKVHSKNSTPFKHIIFSPSYHVTPAVLYFQPYDVSPSSLGLTIAAGLKIEHANIAGFAVNIEQPESSLDDNNAQILNAAIRLDKVTRVNIHPTPGENRISLAQREPLDRTKQGVMIAFRSLLKVIFPRIDNEHVVDEGNPDPATFGQTPEDHHYSLDVGFNIKAGTNGQINMSKDSVYLWSSYRYVHKKKNPAPSDISMIATLRPFYGNNVTLSRSKNPTLLIPH